MPQKLNYDRAKRKPRRARARKPRVYEVHPNSTAARKWKRKTWRTSR